MPAISECERGLAHPTYKKSAKKKMANLYCQLQIDQRDPRYENALCYLKEEDVLLCRAKFAVWTGCREEGRRLCSELMAEKPKKFTSCAYKGSPTPITTKPSTKRDATRILKRWNT